MMSRGDADIFTEWQSKRAEVIESVERIAELLPAIIKLRIKSALLHNTRSFALFDIDREMASFRAITAQEEAASAIIAALQMRRYPLADKLKAQNHKHKAAIIACVLAIAARSEHILQEFKLTFKFDTPRIDIHVPLSNFNVVNGERYGVQFTEPLDLISTVPGIPEDDVHRQAMERLAERSGKDEISRLVEIRANDRNTLLYASNQSLPESKAKEKDILHRADTTLAMAVVTAMIYQTKKHQGIPKQALPAILSVLRR